MWRTDLVSALRIFRHRPGLAAVAVLSLGLGLGGNALIFGLVDGLVLRPFPFPDADRFVTVAVTFPRVSPDERFIECLSPAEYLDIRGLSALQHTSAFDLGNRNLSGGDQPERVFTALVWGNPFASAAMPPLHGRGFVAEECGSGRRPRRHPEPSNLAQSLRRRPRSGRPHGTRQRHRHDRGRHHAARSAPRRHGSLAAAERGSRRVRSATAVSSRSSDAWRRGPRSRSLTRSSRHSPLRTTGDFGRQMPEYQDWRLQALPLDFALTREQRPAGLLLLATAAIVLLIACVNLANVWLARTAERQRDVAIRVSLGASRSAIVRSLLLETLIVSMAGMLVGAALAWMGLAAARALIPEHIRAFGFDVGMTGRVVGYTTILAGLAGLAIGIGPALRASVTRPESVLRDHVGVALPAAALAPPARRAHRHRSGARDDASRGRRCAGAQLRQASGRRSRLRPRSRADHAPDAAAREVPERGV